jgi:hypothetical protein
VFGAKAWPIRVFDVVALAVALAACGTALVRLADRPTALFGMLLAAIWYFDTSFWNTAQPDGWAAMLILVAVCPFLGTSRVLSWHRAFTVGILIALATLLKVFYAMFALIPLIGILTYEGLGGSEKRRLVGAGILGFGACIGVFCAWFLAQHGLNDFLETYLGYNAANVPLRGDTRAWIDALVAHFLHKPRVALLVVAAAGGLAWLAAHHRRDAYLGAAWLALGLGGASLMGRWEGYDMHVTHFALIFFAALGVGQMGQRMLRSSRAITLSLLVLLAVTSAEPSLRHGYVWARWVAGRLPAANYKAEFDVFLGFSYDASSAIARYVESRTDPDDRVLAVENPLINYLARRRGIGRYLSPAPGWDVAVANESERRSRFLTDLINMRPKYVVLGPPAVFHDTVVAGVPLGGSVTPELAQVIRDSYALEVQCDGHFLYILNGAVPSGPGGPAAGGTTASAGRPCSSL